MSYNQMLYSKVREYIITSTDARLHGSNSSIGAAPTFWMFTLPQAPENSYDEVYPGIYMGDSKFVLDKEHLKKLGITHLVNCSQGKSSREINTDSGFYRDAGIKFLGIKALDTTTFNMMPYFLPAAEFINKALKGGGKVFIHCFKGVSRSATIFIAYLMLKCNINLLEAAKIVRARRKVHPNDGFIRQLCILNRDLFEKTSD
ncbi:dual specificity protein phosphatase 3-like [Mercenaria mercenaria]|uniref:dual specificity protein phosphatase 3-like n=1 Tax=Mercenaria mercenaria TaxID=6596 RepID=UPI001E1DCFD0|nr:dual specificity protein phosphatase 3-like [Mercenaria mercenaria]XP_045193966.1 dual specificity protein phosphatase 3-like [Mercenaria mercenaria]